MNRSPHHSAPPPENSEHPGSPGLSAAPAICLDSVSRSFTRHAPRGPQARSAPESSRLVEAVRHASLTIGTGEIVALLGPNGAGKTTTLDLILGQYSPTSGSVSVFGQPPRAAIRAGRVSALLQTGGLLPDYTVRETVRAVEALQEHTIGAEAALQQAGLSEIADQRIGKCSGGQQQRVKFALALLPDPDLIILDEPTAGMDVTARRAFWEAMRAQADRGRTVLFATHYLEEAEAFAERIVLMSRGRIIADGPTHQLRAQAGGKRVDFTWPAATALPPLLQQAELSDEAEGAVSAFGLRSLTRRGSRVSLLASETDTLARWLLTETEACEIEIHAPSLEDAFTALTGEELKASRLP